MTTPPAPVGAVEGRTQELGRALLEEAGRYRPGPAERVQDWLLTHAVADDRFRSRLLRYMDVLASLDYDEGGREAKRLAREYFGADFPGLPRSLRWLLRIARDEHLPAPIVGETARRAAALFARRFITPPGAGSVAAAVADLDGHGRHPSFDLLGEAVLSEAEADRYVASYLALLDQLAAQPAAGQRTAGDRPALELSLKLSSLTAHFAPVDPEGTLRRVRPRLEAIAERAREAGVGLTVDAEQHELRDLTWHVVRSVFARGEPLDGWPDLGVVLQGYLRDAEAHAEELLAFAEARGTLAVRLVKGAYWDYETIVAEANRWPSPVYAEKQATDAAFERLLARLVPAHTALRLAVGSHNARAHALAEALAERARLPASAVEHQTLYRTAEGTSRALAALGWAARDYVPVGELLPGMAYLVRRVLENSSQVGVLLQSRAGAPPEELLRPPRPPAPAEPGPRPLPGAFQRMAVGRWHDAAFRARFDAALAQARARFGERFELRVADEVLDGGEEVAIASPSHPLAAGGEPVGRIRFARTADVERAALVASAGARRWGALPVGERARVLRHAAELAEARAHELAAWVVHEGGRDRVGAYAEVEEAVDFLRYNAAEAERLWARHGQRVAPRGVVAVIPPWNFSLAIPCGMTAAALAAGNAVVLKPAEQTPLIATRLVALLHEAGVPREALICLPGRGEEVGAALAQHPLVAMVAFTGSRAVGEWLHEAAWRAPTASGAPRALVAELGGKNAALVFADADLDEAVAGVVGSAFGHANQKCSAVSRVLVQAPVAERFAARLAEAAASLEVGAADAPGTQLNPLIDGEAAARLDEAARAARAECEPLLDRFAGPVEGDPMREKARGSLARGPLVVRLPTARALDARTETEELFGPILVLIPFEGEEEAYAIANGTPYALTAGVFSRSPRTIEHAANALAAGNVYVNRGTTGARPGVEPFGGMRMSGTGPKAGGPDYLWAFVRRSDAADDEPDEAAALAALAVGAPEDGAAAELPPLAERWDAPLEARAATVERAAVLLADRGHPHAEQLLSAAQAARRELGRPAGPARTAHRGGTAHHTGTVPVPGQHTEMRHETPRGRALLRARRGRAAWWLAAPLLAGDAVLLVDSPALAEAAAALHEAGVPTDVLRPDESAADGEVSAGESSEATAGLDRLLALAGAPGLALAAVDGGPALGRALAARLAPTPEGQRWLTALLSPLDGPQPGEDGFVARFALPQVVAVRTLRHGADLASVPLDSRGYRAP